MFHSLPVQDNREWGSKVRKLRDEDDGCPLSGRPDMGTVYPASCEPYPPPLQHILTDETVLSAHEDLFYKHPRY